MLTSHFGAVGQMVLEGFSVEPDTSFGGWLVNGFTAAE